MCIIYIYITPFKRKNVTTLSKTPKRHRIQPDNDQWEDVENTYILNEESFENVEHEEDVKGSESVVLERILQALEKSGFKEIFLIFFELILDGKYPLDSISLILFLETVQFF